MMLLLVVWSLSAAVEDISEYEVACERMVSFATEASKAHNVGDARKERVMVSKLEESFATAIMVDEVNPQAYVHMATFRLNSHDFQEALVLWRKALARLPAETAAWAYVKDKERYTRLGLYSKKRDRAYAAGDAREALRWTLKQREIVPESPRVAYDIATFYATLTNDDFGPEYAASQRFAAAAAARHLGIAAWKIDALEPGAPASERYGAFEAGGVEATTLENVAIAGPDCVVVRTGERLEILGAAPHAPLHANLWLAESTWLPGSGVYDHSTTRRWQPRASGDERVSSAALAIPFAASNFYHFLTDAIPRVVALRERADLLLVPSVSRRLQRYLELAAPDAKLMPLETRDSPPGIRLRVDRLAVLAFDPVRATDGEPTHALTPAPLLRATREAVLARLSPRKETTRLVVLASRGSASTRRFANESLLLDRLPPGTIDFDGAETDVDDAISLFRSAAVVVGVHGAALANALWCVPGTLVVELGFRAAAARHYEHLAAALGLDYRRVLLEPDDRSFTAPLVVASPAAIEAVVDAVETRLRDLDLSGACSSSSSSRGYIE